MLTSDCMLDVLTEDDRWSGIRLDRCCSSSFPYPRYFTTHFWELSSIEIIKASYARRLQSKWPGTDFLPATENLKKIMMMMIPKIYWSIGFVENVYNNLKFGLCRFTNLYSLFLCVSTKMFVKQRHMFFIFFILKQFGKKNYWNISKYRSPDHHHHHSFWKCSFLPRYLDVCPIWNPSKYPWKLFIPASSLQFHVIIHSLSLQVFLLLLFTPVNFTLLQADTR